MCWKYENHCSICFDDIFEGPFWNGEGGLYELLKEWNLKINDKDKFETMFFDFLSDLYEKKIIDGENDTNQNRLETWAEELKRKNNE